MGFLSVVHSDRGIKKNTNQDSVLIKEASTDYGDVIPETADEEMADVRCNVFADCRITSRMRRI